jgi:hypothetical protein
VIYAVVPLVVAIVCLWLGRRLATVLVILAYLSIEGFLKLLSNYNRIVHVGLDIIVLLLAGYFVLQAVVERRAHLDELPYTKLILVYALWMVLQLLNPFSPGLTQSIAAFKIHLTMVPLYFIAASVFRNREDIIKFCFGMSLIVFVPYGMSLLQYALGPSSVLDLSPRFWVNLGYYHEFRPFGTSAVPGGSSVMAYLVVPLSVVLLSIPDARKTMKPLALLSIMLAAGTFIVSGVRQVFLACALIIAVMAVLMMMRRSGRIAVVAALVGLVGFGAYVGVQTYLRPMSKEAIARDPRSPDIWREREVTDRLLTLSTGSTYVTARDNPLAIIMVRATKFPFGAGMGRTGSASGTFKSNLTGNAESARIQAQVGWSDSFFADMIAEGGIPALIMLLWILIGMTWRAYRLSRTAQDPAIMAASAALCGFYVSVLAMSYGSTALLGNPVTAFFWFFSGMCAGMQKIESQQLKDRGQVEVLEDAAEDGLTPATWR